MNSSSTSNSSNLLFEFAQFELAHLPSAELLFLQQPVEAISGQAGVFELQFGVVIDDRLSQLQRVANPVVQFARGRRLVLQSQTVRYGLVTVDDRIGELVCWVRLVLATGPRMQRKPGAVQDWVTHATICSRFDFGSCATVHTVSTAALQHRRPDLQILFDAILATLRFDSSFLHLLQMIDRHMLAVRLAQLDQSLTAVQAQLKIVGHIRANVWPHLERCKILFDLVHAILAQIDLVVVIDSKDQLTSQGLLEILDEQNFFRMSDVQATIHCGRKADRVTVLLLFGTGSQTDAVVQTDQVLVGFDVGRLVVQVVVKCLQAGDLGLTEVAEELQIAAMQFVVLANEVSTHRVLVWNIDLAQCTVLLVVV